MDKNHYFSKNNDDLESNPQKIICKYDDHNTFTFKTDNGVFSKEYVDYASLILLKNLQISNGCKLLDVGCGYGPIGVITAKLYSSDVTMIDINKRALLLSEENLKLNNVSGGVLESDCLDSVLDSKFDVIITNPPIRAGKEVIYKIFEQSKEVLNENGTLWIVMQYKHGAESAIKKLKTIFNEVNTVYKKKGYYVIVCS